MQPKNERAETATGERLAAVALRYESREPAPRVVAKGQGLIAEQILERAREAGVYVHESPELLSLLMKLDLDERIPPQLYVAVAELLAWVYRLEQEGGGGNPLPPRAPPPESML